MTFALIQKLNPTFLSGDFFYFELITDARFSFIGELINTNLASIVQETDDCLNRYYLIQIPFY